MSDITSETKHPAADPNGVPAKPASNRLQIMVVAIVGAALALLIAYQLFGCAACY
jgi:hypothetical protein